MPAATLPRSLGELRASKQFSETKIKTRSVKDEMRQNLMARLKAREQVFPGIVGYEDTVIPQIVNAVLSKQNFILLGLRGQAKSRILRALTALLDEQMAYVAGCEIRDNPYQPLCRRCRDLIAERGDATPIAWLGRDDRYVEKLATPDVTVADLIGDLDPIKAARGGEDLSSELTMHYGLLPRANRGLFAINELPDLAGKIQVALFNIMQEGDVQIKGYPVRLALDVALVFSANPEDYTARGKIITPLKDRIGSEIRTHYPETLEEGVAITAQEAWAARGDGAIEIPQYLREVVEQVAFSAREDKKVDKRSGVSQRLPISTLELVVSNAERRGLLTGDTPVLPRVSDIYAAMPGITGKLELEYEGEMRGADTVVRELIRAAVGKVYDRYFEGVDTAQIEQWFNLGGKVKLDEDQPAAAALKELKGIQGLLDKLTPLGVKASDPAPQVVAAAEFLLEGMVAHRKLSRNEQHGFAAEKSVRLRDREDAPSRAQRFGDGVRRLAARAAIAARRRIELRREAARCWPGRPHDSRRGRRGYKRGIEKAGSGMKRIHYTKYTGDLASEIDLESLLQALSDYLLDSGFYDPLNDFQDLDHTLDDLREALRRVLETGDFFDGETRELLDRMMAEGTLDELIDKLMERMERENYHLRDVAERPDAHGRSEWAGGQRGRPESRERALRSDRQEPGLSGLQDAARSDGVAGQIELWTPRHAALGNGN